MKAEEVKADEEILEYYEEWCEDFEGDVKRLSKLAVDSYLRLFRKKIIRVNRLLFWSNKKFTRNEYKRQYLSFLAESGEIKFVGPDKKRFSVSPNGIISASEYRVKEKIKDLISLIW